MNIQLINTTGLRLAGTGTLPDPATIDYGLGWVDDGGKLWRRVCVFHNEGTDYINLGRSSWLSKINPTTSWTFETKQSLTTLGSDHIFIGLADSQSTTASQFYVRKFLNNTLGVCVGGVAFYQGSTVLSANTVYTITVKTDGTSFKVYLNGVLEITGTCGTFVSAGNLIVGSWIGNSSFNVEGDTCCVEFYEGVGNIDNAEVGYLTPIEMFPLEQQSGLTVQGKYGTTGTVTDGSPTGIWKPIWKDQQGNIAP